MSDHKRARSKPPAADDSPGKPENIEIVIDHRGITSRSRWTAPWGFAVLVTMSILASGALKSYLPWFAGAAILVLTLWLGLLELHVGRPRV
jgi:hypothetical protein